MEITGYRAFERFSLHGLSRVNLLVGKNNSGKTSILEAAQILASRENPTTLWLSLGRRSEFTANSKSEIEAEFEAEHLFYGHQLRLGNRFTLGGFDGEPIELSCEVAKQQPFEKIPLGLFSEFQGSNCLKISLPYSEPRHIPISINGGITNQTRRFLSSVNWLDQGVDNEKYHPVKVVSTGVNDFQQMSSLWDEIALTPDEPEVIRALQIIEPNLEQLAFLGRDGRSQPLIYAKFKGSKHRVPIGSLGDGVTRILGLAIAVISARNGAVMIDEIDTGFHYSIMQGMWKMIINTAARLNIQVFATTHSLDCIQSLAQLQMDVPELMNDVSLHRIEKGLDKAIRFGAEELAIACKHDIELRGMA